MEKDVANLEELQSMLSTFSDSLARFLTLPSLDSHESVLIMLQNAEQQVEDLKLQLDDALGAEEMLVQLTERNLMLSEVIFHHLMVVYTTLKPNFSAENRRDARQYRGLGGSQRTQR